MTLIKAIAADGAHPFDDVELNLNRHGDFMEQHRLTLTRRNAVVALLGSAAAITTTEASVISAVEAIDDRRKPVYHESEHVRTYYAVNRM